MTLSDQSTDEDRREEVHLWIDADDFTSEETWRLVRWCREHGADEFTLDFNNVDEARIPLASSLAPAACAST